MKKFFAEFKKFISKGNVLDMAVGVIIGSAFSAIVNSLVKDIITPVISIITGGTDLTDLKAILRPEVLDDAGEIVTPALTLNYGVFIQAVINFLIIAMTLFVIIKVAMKSSEMIRKAQVKVQEGKATKEDTYVCSFSIRKRKLLQSIGMRYVY